MMRRPWALPLVPCYAAALAMRNGLWDRGYDVRALRQPVLSVGSVAAGGAGKTPVVLALARLLARHGVAVDVLSRGYGRSSVVTAQVDPTGTADAFGDEPLELARAGLDVYVGAQRYAAGLLAERDGAKLHLLDDGFQHRGLERAFDMVLVTAEDLRDTLLPAGNLREPLRALGRADLVLVRADEQDALLPQLARWSSAPVLTLRRTLHLPAGLGSRPLAFCAIARPAGFFNALVEAGCTPAATHSFRDHQRLAPGDLQMLLDRARQSGADSFVTTAKDAARLAPTDHARLASYAPVAVATLEVQFTGEGELLYYLRAVPGLLPSGTGA